MKERLVLFLKIYITFVCLFMLQKPLFMAMHIRLYADASFADWLSVMWHGLPLDLSLAGYLTALPALLLVVSLWTLRPWLMYVLRGYFGLVALLMGSIFIIDGLLYDFWGFRLDSTPLFYFFTSPKDVVASVDWYYVVSGVFFIVLATLVLYAIFHVLLLTAPQWRMMCISSNCFVFSFILLIVVGVLFIPIRGGFTVSTMNTGKVYFSPDQRLNHAAINPAFSLMESLSKQKDFASQYRFLAPEEADRRFCVMQDPAVMIDRFMNSCITVHADSASRLFHVRRPDILLVILEGFSSHLMNSLGGEPGVAVTLDSLAGEGVLFTNFYANSFRTDRALVSILSGYPAQPTTSIMKYPRKTQSIPALAGALRDAGYDTKYYYGGDADFTNMRSYLMSSGFNSIISDTDFPLTDRLSKWGVHDHLVFRRLLDDLTAEGDTASRPRLRVLQTSSSHEPFEVPFRRLANDRLNAFAYTDSCLGDFICRYRRLPQWERTVIVMVPDHQGGYPEQMDNLSFDRYKIPLLMVGGAVDGPRRIDVCGSQQDIAATLLAQLGLHHGNFIFSKDLMNEGSPHFAFFTFPDAFGILSEDGRVVYDNQAGRPVLLEGPAADELLLQGKAYLQKLYDDIANR